LTKKEPSEPSHSIYSFTNKSVQTYLQAFHSVHTPKILIKPTSLLQPQSIITQPGPGKLQLVSA